MGSSFEQIVLKILARTLKKSSPSACHAFHWCPAHHTALLFHTIFIVSFDTELTAHDGNQEFTERDSAVGWTVWSCGRYHSTHRLWAKDTGIEVSSEFSPINVPTKQESFNLENHFKIAVSEDTDLLAAVISSSSSKHCTSVVEKHSSMGKGDRDVQVFRRYRKDRISVINWNGKLN